MEGGCSDLRSRCIFKGCFPFVVLGMDIGSQCAQGLRVSVRAVVVWAVSLVQHWTSLCFPCWLWPAPPASTQWRGAKDLGTLGRAFIAFAKLLFALTGRSGSPRAPLKLIGTVLSPAFSSTPQKLGFHTSCYSDIAQSQME